MALTQISTDGIKNGTITGTDLATNVDLVDNQKLRFGTGNDLQIYHDGTNNYIEGNNQKTVIRNTSNNIHIQAKSGEGGIDVLPNSAVKLYHDGSAKFETTSYGAKWTGNLLGADNQQLQLGSSGDLQIYHDGTNSYIDNVNTGILRIRGGSGGSGRDIQIQAKNGEFSINAIPNGAVELYYDNTKRFETVSNGVQITGTLDVNGGGITLEDTAHIELGNNADLIIKHDGSTSRIHSASHNLNIRTPRFAAFNGAGTEDMLKAFENGAVELYYDNSKKFETTNTGIQVTGQVYADSAHINGELDLVGNLDLNSDSHKIKLGAGDDFQFYHDGSNNYIFTNNGDINITTTGDDISLTAADDIFLNPQNGEDGIKVFGNGAVELYHDNSKKFETTADGIDVSGQIIATISGADVGLTIAQNGTGDILNLYAGGNLAFKINSVGNPTVTSTNPVFASTNSSSSVTTTLFSNSSGQGVLQTNSGSDLIFGTGSVEKVRITSAGNVGIGTTSPAAKFHISKSYSAPTGGVDGNTCLLLSNSGGSAYAGLAIQGTTSGGSYIHFGDTDDINVGNILYDHPSNSMQFITNATEGMRIDSDGRVLIGATSPLYSEFLSVQKGGSNVNCATFHFTNTHDNTAVIIRHNRAGHQGSGTNATMINFANKQNTSSGTITSNGSSTSYNTSSDYRLKENEIPMSDGITRLKTLKPYRFNFKVDTTRTLDGFFAHEVQSVVPEAVAKEKDAVDKDGNIDPQQLDQSKLVPLLVAAVQEAIGRIETLETKVAALKAG